MELDETLYRRYLNGEGNALRELIERHRKGLTFLCVRHVYGAAVGVWMTIKAKTATNKITIYFMAMGIFGFALGNIYFVLFYFLRGYSAYSSAADVAWIGAFFFFISAHHLLELESVTPPMVHMGYGSYYSSCVCCIDRFLWTILPFS